MSMKDMMFGRNNLIKIIHNGDLTRLKKLVEKKPERLKEWFKWPDTLGSYSNASGNALHIAAYFNQPEIIKFLATEKGMNIDQRNQISRRTPLHYAAENGQYEATQTLLKFGADANLKNSQGNTAFDLCRDASTKGLLRSAYEELQEKEKSAMQERALRRQEEAHEEAKIRAEGTWSLTSANEIVHQYEAPVGQYRITDIFNFETERLITITKDLDNGQSTPLRQSFKDASIREIEQAKSKLDELNSGAHGETPPATPRRDDAYKYNL